MQCLQIPCKNPFVETLALSHLLKDVADPCPSVVQRFCRNLLYQTETALWPHPRWTAEAHLQVTVSYREEKKKKKERQ